MGASAEPLWGNIYSILGGALAPPPVLLPLGTPTREDKLFVELLKAVTKYKAGGAMGKSWILDYMWRLVDMRVSMLRDPMRD